MAQLHQQVKYGWTYVDKHMVSLVCAALDEAAAEHDKVMHPFIFPLHDQIAFEQKVAAHVLMMTKEGDFKTANRTEREMLNMMHAKDIGFAKTYTTDFLRAKEAMRRMYLE